MEQKNDVTYEQAYARLDMIVQKLNGGAIPLDEMVALYEEGMELAAQCAQLLKSYDARLERVSKRSLLRELEKAMVGGEHIDADDSSETFEV